jgi:hypothetical protein
MRVLKISGFLPEFPLPEIFEPSVELVLDKVGYVLADDGEELETVVRTGRGDYEILRVGIRADSEVEICRHAIPDTKS